MNELFPCIKCGVEYPDILSGRTIKGKGVCAQCRPPVRYWYCWLACTGFSKLREGDWPHGRKPMVWRDNASKSGPNFQYGSIKQAPHYVCDVFHEKVIKSTLNPRETIYVAATRWPILENLRERWKNWGWSEAMPNRMGIWQIRCDEAKQDPETVFLYREKGVLWVRDPSIGSCPVDHYHGNLAKVTWRKLPWNK